ncbi:ferritin-like domain-containing protein [Haloferula rosea]|uniref:Ferritin-like domain-containing protein n=1 Tax=Haloferula rosea TaxID=490093 RepID=A0A934R979_9BACT|nr:ferritin-like domain-containing protein [Haloferula rosea]MBK1826672.1 ferritin-like domain-containing protein [Haloferula rosea]
MKLDNLHKLLIHELKDIYSAETQLLKAIPVMADAANDPDLEKAFRKHLEETEGQVKRLETVFESLDFQPGGHRCEAMAGLIKEGEEMVKADAEPEVRDAGLIAAAQRVEHYEMAAYGTAVALAEKLSKHDIVETLRKSLEEEGKTDRDLTALAERVINFKAMVA